MSYTVKIFKTIWAGKVPSGEGMYKHRKYVSEDYPENVPLEYILELPFPPYVGLSINNEGESHYFRSGEIKAVTWFHSDQIFGCWVEDAEPYSSRGYDYNYEYLVDRAVKEGWKIVE